MVMEALCELAPGDSILLLLDREPFPLYRVLQRNGYRHSTTQCDDGHFEVEIAGLPHAGARGAQADADAD